MQGKNLVSERIKNKGIDNLKTSLAEIRGLAESGGDIYFDEPSINVLGYQIMNQGNIPAAIEIFRLNVERFPESYNVYDSLAEAYMNNGDTE